MLNVDQKLNPKLFQFHLEQVPIRRGFGEGLLEAAEVDERVVGLCADLTESTQMHLFKNKFPHRFIELGVAEQNLAAVASGLAAMGKVPFISSYATFSPGRNWEQIRTTICYNNRPVKIAGSHAGVSVGPDGGTHQALEDLALMRVLPRMVVIVPCDTIEARKATVALAKTNEPTYIRLGREPTPVITTADSPFVIGRANLLRAPSAPQATIVACGALVYEALEAANELAAAGVEVAVLNMHTLKPLDSETLVKLAKASGAVVTVEEHQRAGGLGGAVAETLAANYPVPVEFVGVDDQFGQSGTPRELIAHYHLNVTAIQAAVRKVLLRRPQTVRCGPAH